MQERTLEQRIGDCSYQLSLAVHQLKRIAQVLESNKEFYISEDEFNTKIASKLK